MPIHAIILAAGRGERMAPLTDVVPKANLPVVDTHLIDRLISSLRLAGIEDCTVGVGWKHEVVAGHLRNNPENAGVNVVNVARWEVGPLMTLFSTLQHTKDDTVLVCPVDCVIEPPAILSVTRAHGLNRSGGYLATLAVDSVSAGGTRVFADNAGRISGIGRGRIESREVGRSAMLLVLEPEFRAVCRASLEKGHTRVADALKLAISDGAEVGYSLVEWPWYDVDDVSSLLDANAGLLSSSTVSRAGWMRVPAAESVNAEEHVQTDSDIVLESGTSIVGPSLVAPDTVVRRGSKIGPFVVIGAGTEIGKSCRIANAVLFGDSSLPPNSHVDSVVVHDGVVYGRK